jgi:carbon storage regulator
MLVLTRRIGEMLLVGDDIQVKIIDVRGDRVRIGITAPKGLPITRPAPQTPPANRVRRNLVRRQESIQQQLVQIHDPPP